MFHALLRILGWLNLLLFVVALLFLPSLLKASFEGAEGAWLPFALVTLDASMLAFGGAGLLMRRKWSKPLNLTTAGIFLVQGVGFGILGEYGLMSFCVPYASLAGWLLIPAVHAEYFRGEGTGQN